MAEHDMDSYLKGKLSSRCYANLKRHSAIAGGNNTAPAGMLVEKEKNSIEAHPEIAESVPNKFNPDIKDDDFFIIENVPIFDEEDPELGDIDEIIANNNRRFEDTGDKAVLTLGHTLPGTEELETNQPPVVGFADDFKRSKLGKKNVVTATFRIWNKFKDLVKQFPRRSVEMWKHDKIIDVIALCGASRPMKDLGLLATFNRPKLDKELIHINYEDKDMSDKTKCSEDNVLVEDAVEAVGETDAVTNDAVEAQEVHDAQSDLREQVLAIINESELGKFVRKQMEKYAAEEHVEDEPVQSDEIKSEEMTEENKEEEVEGQDYTGDPPLTNPALMAMAAHEIQDEQENKQKDKFSMMEQELNLMRKKFIESEREKDLIRLAAEYNFDHNMELKYAVSLNDEQYQNHLGNIKKNYRRLPLGRGFIAPIGSLVENGKVDKDRMTKAVNYAQKNKVTFEEALKNC